MLRRNRKPLSGILASCFPKIKKPNKFCFGNQTKISIFEKQSWLYGCRSIQSKKEIHSNRKFGSYCFCKIKKPNKNFLKLKCDWWCLYFDMTDSYLRFIPTNNQTTLQYFFFWHNFFSHNWCSYFDTTDGYLRYIPTNGQTTVLFFQVILWSTKQPDKKHS